MTDQYAVIGYPVGSSLSPQIHHAFAKQTGENIAYTILEAPLHAFDQTVHGFIERGARGANVTVPFKQSALSLCGRVSAAARIAGAVNTLCFHEDGAIEGHNTDGIGFIRDITRRHQQTLTSKTILILGAGGVAHGIIAPILAEHPASITVANRTYERAQACAAHFQSVGDVTPVAMDTLGEQSFDVVIQATSVRQSSDWHVPGSILHENTFCYDINYCLNENTVFLEWCRHLGVKTVVDGLGMLVEQAAVSFELWRGVQPETNAVVEMVKRL